MDEMTWLNEPPSWEFRDGELTVTTGERTDFWQHTAYGFARDNGHFLSRLVRGDFVAEVAFSARYEVLYDQCGLMVRAGALQWLKTGIELTAEGPRLSAVATRGLSDWSVAPIELDVAPVVLRVLRRAEAVRVERRLEDGSWTLVRLAALDLGEECAVGMMCCSPERAGFVANFRDFRVSEELPEGAFE